MEFLRVVHYFCHVTLSHSSELNFTDSMNAGLAFQWTTGCIETVITMLFTADNAFWQVKLVNTTRPNIKIQIQKIYVHNALYNQQNQTNSYATVKTLHPK